MEINYTDRSLAGRILGLLARQQQKAPDIVRKNSLVLIRVMLAKARSERLKDIYQNAMAFLERPKGFKLLLEPTTPLPLSRIDASGLENPDPFVERLGARLIATP